MATILISGLIFSFTGWVICKQVTKKGCDGCDCGCGSDSKK